ncbi:MAG: molybdopterin-dependent oxidoreductase [Quadrisphaera sp.]
MDLPGGRREVAAPRTWTWDDVHALPSSSYEGDIHCVTTWSKLGTSFTGVSLDALLDQVEVLPSATHVLAWSSSGYNHQPAPGGRHRRGRRGSCGSTRGAPLTAEHGGPVRMLVPHLYFWKSTKWVAGLRLLDHDEPGFWERNGYHDRGEPWAEQRYAGD